MNFNLVTPFVDLAQVRRTSLDVRDYLTVGDILGARRMYPKSEQAFEQQMYLVGCVAGLDPKEVASLDVRDVETISAHLEEIQRKKESAKS